MDLKVQFSFTLEKRDDKEVSRQGHKNVSRHEI
jgi:hypothetical protein